MELKTKYITPEDLLIYAGEDLAGGLVDGDNPSNKAYAFISRIENRMAAYIDVAFHQNVDKKYTNFTDYQKEHYKLALLEQCIYVLKNGEIGADSGYEQESGIVADSEALKSLVIGFYAQQQLILCGLWCTDIN